MKIFLTLFLAVAALFTGCNSEAPLSDSRELASVNLTIETEETKSLTVTNQNATITGYGFKAVSSSQEAKGKSTDYESFGSSVDNTCEIESRFSPGYWTFEVQAKNANGIVLYEGSECVYLGSGNNDVTVTVSPVINSGENLSGTLTIDVSAPKLKASEDGVFKAYSTNLTTNSDQAVEITGLTKKQGFNTEGYCSGYKASHSLAPGFYILSVQYFEDSQAEIPCSTAVIPFRIIEGSSTTVSGTLEGFLFSTVTLSVATQNLGATMSASSSSFTVTPQASGYTNLSYRWFINGTRVGETTGTLSLTTWFGSGEGKVEKTPGYYCITCVVMAQNAGGTYEAVCCKGHVMVNASGNFVGSAVE